MRHLKDLQAYALLAFATTAEERGQKFWPGFAKQ